MPTPAAAAKHIKALQTAIDTLKGDIDDYVKLFIPDFHFMTHKVSTFWECEKSPVGMCVFKVELGPQGPQATHCYYCHGPTERK